MTYGDGYAYLTGFSSNRLVPLIRAVCGLLGANIAPRSRTDRRAPLASQGDPNDPNSAAGPNGGRGFAVPAAYADIDGSSVWMMKWCALGLALQVERTP